MVRKSKQSVTTKAESFPRKAIPCHSGASDDEKGRAYANLINSPELAAHRIVSMAQPKSLADEIDVPGMLESLRDHATAVQSGDLSRVEAMLANQASALQALFVRLTERAMEQSQMPNFEGFMRMALRAQSQCRATLETLVATNNPPIVYARQANVTTGPQQINNAMAAPTRAQETENEQTQLSEDIDELRTDARAPGHASRVNPTLEALGEIDRAEVRRG